MRKKIGASPRKTHQALGVTVYLAKKEVFHTHSTSWTRKSSRFRDVSVDVALPSGAEAGDVLFAFTGNERVTAPSGWTTANSLCWYKMVDGTEPSTFAFICPSRTQNLK